MGDQLPADHALAGIVAFGLVIRQAGETAMRVTAAEYTRDMTEDELRLAHEAGTALGQLAGSELARRRRT